MGKNTPPTAPDTTPVAATTLEPHTVATLLRMVSMNDLFASRARFKVPGIEAFDTKDWIEWKALRPAALVDRDTISKDGQHYFAPEPLEPGKVFLAPDAPFWRSIAEQGIIERVKPGRR